MCVICSIIISTKGTKETNNPDAKSGERRKNMSKERTILETIVFAYLVGEREWSPIKARAKVESMTDQELEDFVN